MNFEFSEDQNLLREQARGFLADHCPTTAVRKVLNAEAGHDADLWRKVVDMGWTATTIPEEFGGLGLGYLELCVIAEELGRAVAPIPFSSSVYLATEALLLAGSQAQKEKWLPKLAAGEVIGTFAMSEGAGRTTAKSLKTRINGGRITGTKVPVPDAAVAGIAIVLAGHSGGDGGTLCLVELGQGTTITPVKTVDPSRGHSELQFDGAVCEVLGREGEGFALTQTLLDRAAVPFAWEQVGGSEAALEQARAYALGRYAFGRPIASYQAIKHKLANMYVKNTLARSNCYYGAWALSTDAPELSVAAATARVSATEAFHECSKENIQTHGGMGFTWEFDCHLYYRRSKLLSLNLGALPRWKDRLVTQLEHSNS